MHGGSKCESHYAHACTRSMEGLLFVLALDYIAMGLYEYTGLQTQRACMTSLDPLYNIYIIYTQAQWRTSWWKGLTSVVK